MKDKTTSPPRLTAQSRAPWGRLVLISLTVAIAGGTWALFEFVVWNKLPATLVGSWEVKEGPQKGAVFDFYRNGTVVGHVNFRDKLGIVKAGVRLEGDKLYWTTFSEQGQKDERIQMVRTLTERRLVLEDERGGLLKMERAD